MDLHLGFSGGIVSGDGVDDVGSFGVHGRYDPGSGECTWTKSYLGAHSVFYRGFAEGKGIWGTWEIPAGSRGGFHIWPRGSEAGLGAAEKAAAKRTARISIPPDLVVLPKP